MKVSIRGVIITGFIVLIWGTLLISTPFSYISNKKVMLVHTMDIMENISDLTVKQTQNFFSTARGAARLTKRLISSKVVYTDSDNIEKLEKYFFDQLEIYPQFAGIYFASPKGDFYYVSRSSKFVPDGYRTKFIEMTPQGARSTLIWRDREMNVLGKTLVKNELYDPRNRPWFKKAIKEKQVIWTAPYIFFTSKEPGITTAGPIYDNDNLVGVVGVDIELDVLSNFIGNLRVGKTGVAFMVDDENNVIAYPDMEQLKYQAGNTSDDMRLPKLDELSNPLCKLALDAVEKAKETGSSIIPEKNSVYANFTHNSEKYYTMFTPVKESKISWMIGVYIPEKDYFGKLIFNHRINLLLVFFLSCIATIVGLYMAREISRPIAELDREASFITNHDYSPRNKIKTSFVELQRTAKTFHAMKDAVIAYKTQLKKEEQIHRTITETANEAILMINENDIIAFWNAAAEQIFGYTANEALGKNIYDLKPFSKSSSIQNPNLNDVLRKGSKTHSPQITELYINDRKDQPYFVEVSIVNIELEGQQHTISVIHDISKRKKLEDDRIDTLKQLQQAQKMEALGLMAGGVAHDLNNVLSGIVTYPDLILLDLPKESPLRPAITMIRDSGKEAASIVDDLLTLARRGVPNFEPINLNHIIEDYLGSSSHLSLVRQYDSVTINTNLDADLCNLNGARIHLNKTVMNLVYNAAEATKNGGRITISTENISFNPPIKKNDTLYSGEFVLLTVQDTGVGIAPDDLKRIFEPFYTSKVMGRSGTGLGMSVVWGTVQDHNGFIDVKSKPGQGTTIKLYLPVTKQETKNPDAITTIKDYSGNGEVILVIDDVKEQRDIAATLLERLNYNVKKASSGEKAIEFLAENKVDILVMDMIMDDGMDGLDTYKKAIELNKGQKAIIVSGFSDDDRVRQAQQLGAGEYIKKPYTLEKIGLAIKKELGK